MLEVTARLRPRTGWESQDLGLAMVRSLFPRLLGQWLGVLVPLWAAMTMLLWHSPGWLLLLVWWLKPVYDRLPLFTLGRKLFGEETRLITVLRNAPRLLLLGNVYFLTFGRLSPYRSMAMAVKVLEGGKFSAYRRRVRVLLHQGDSSAGWVTVGWFLVSVVGALGLNLLLQMVSIQAADEDPTPWMMKLFTHPNWAFSAATWRYLAWLYMGSITLTEMFYVGSGFGLYLNSRSHLEGWDIEVAFRSLASRLQQQMSLGVLIVGLLLVGGLRESASAADGPTPQEAIREIKAHPDFTVQTEKFTVFDDEPDKQEEKEAPQQGWNFFDWLVEIMPVLRWLLWSVLAAVILWLLIRYRHLFKVSLSRAPDPLPEARVVMGLDVSGEALPADIPGTAWQHWLQGDLHAAMRLLYAGSIHWMVRHGGVPIRESDTEGDCVRQAAQLSDPAQTCYFQALTQTWIHHTYGQQAPMTSEMEQLVRQWPFRK